MKKIIVIVSIMVAVIAVGVVAAQDYVLPGSGWWSGEQIQNIGTVTATIQVVAYGGGSTYNASSDVAGGASKTFLPADFTGMADGFQGAAIVSSDQPIKGIVNVTNRQVGTTYGVAGGLAAAQYQGMDAGATTLSFPLAKNGHYSKYTTFYLQNAGSAAATATAVFKVPSGSFTYTTPSINPGEMVIVNPSDASVPEGNGVGLGSLTVSSAQPLAGVVLEHGTENPATILQATRGFAPADAATKAYAPIIKNNFYNRFTGLQVQNVSSGNIDITVTYSAIAAGACAGGSFTDQATGVAPGASHTFVHLTGMSNLPEGCLASATVDATGNVVAIVNESYTSAWVGAGHTQESVTSSAFAGSAATMKISVPLFKEDSYNKGTGLQVQNVGTASASVVLTFMGPTGTYVSLPQTIAAGASMTFVDVRNKTGFWATGQEMTPTALGCTATGCAANGVFAITVTSDQPVVAIANESTYPFTAPRIAQDKNNYEGFNLP